jgi:predicted membrane protein
MKTQTVVLKKKMLTYNLSEPLCEATTAKVDIDTASGNLTIDTLTEGEPVLASGTLEYVENQQMPTRSVAINNGQATLTLKSTSMGRPLFRLPWTGCIAATDWQIHLNPDVQADITARSGGGNVKLNLTGMTLTRVMADSGGGNLDVVLPDYTVNLSVTAKTGGGNVTVHLGNGIKGSNILTATSGAGNVEVRIPSGLAACIYATSGWGKEIVDSRFVNIDKHKYQSLDFDRAADKVEITVQSGAGNVIVNAI